MAASDYRKVDSWECQREHCGMIVVSKELHDKWHKLHGDVPLTGEAHEGSGERKSPVRLRSDGEWPV